MFNRVSGKSSSYSIINVFHGSNKIDENQHEFLSCLLVVLRSIIYLGAIVYRVCRRLRIVSGILICKFVVMYIYTFRQASLSGVALLWKKVTSHLAPTSFAKIRRPETGRHQTAMLSEGRDSVSSLNDRMSFGV